MPFRGVLQTTRDCIGENVWAYNTNHPRHLAHHPKFLLDSVAHLLEFGDGSVVQLTFRPSIHPSIHPSLFRRSSTPGRYLLSLPATSHSSVSQISLSAIARRSSQIIPLGSVKLPLLLQRALGTAEKRPCWPNSNRLI